MTIKEFSKLCGCNPQTLRYYDHVDLLKPVKVDQWSGYRYYEKSQAPKYVKIKNLQRAGFSINEIKKLLDQDDSVILKAFDEKIAEAENRVQEIRSIQQSYQAEMTAIMEKIATVHKQFIKSLEMYNPTEEFGIEKSKIRTIIAKVNTMFEQITKEPNHFDLELDDVKKNDVKENKQTPNYFNNPALFLVYEKHDWQNVKDFFDEFSTLVDNQEYLLYFQLEEAKIKNNIAFSNIILELLLEKNANKNRKLGCDIKKSTDGKNHFWLFKGKLS